MLNEYSIEKFDHNQLLNIGNRLNNTIEFKKMNTNTLKIQLCLKP